MKRMYGKRENHPAWKGGRHITNNGYVRIYMPDHHRAAKSGYVLEHIVVMEKKLGIEIKINDGEVHHKDGNRENNDPNNLQLLSVAEHRRKHGFPWKKTTKRYSWGKPEKEKGKVVPKEKLPRGYYYLKII